MDSTLQTQIRRKTPVPAPTPVRRRDEAGRATRAEYRRLRARVDETCRSLERPGANIELGAFLIGRLAAKQKEILARRRPVHPES